MPKAALWLNNMISLSQLKTVLDANPKPSGSEDFLRLHRYLEGYIKRVMLIGLRLNRVQYENSRKIVESTYINTANLIDKVLVLLDQSGRKHKKVITGLKKTYGGFFELKDLLLKFTFVYRNRLAHGTIGELKDQNLLDYLYHVNRSFYKEFEQLLKKEYRHSAFERPRDWGAKNGIQEKIENTVKRLRLGSLVKDPMPLSQVIVKLGKTAYAKP